MAISVVQSLIFDREVFASSADALKWAEDHGFRTDKVDETPGSWRFRQRSPEDFKESSFRTINLRSGVQAVIGRLENDRLGETTQTSIAKHREFVASQRAEANADSQPLTGSVRLNTWNPEARTVDVILSAEGTNVWRYQGWGYEYDAGPSLHPDHVSLERLNNGAPFIMAHKLDEPAAQIGTFVPGTGRIEGPEDGKKIIATVEFSRHLDETREAYVQEIADGIRPNISMGWNDYEWYLIPGSASRPDKFVAIDWELVEGSSVAAGKDDGAKVQSLSGTGESEMDPTVAEALAAAKAAKAELAKIKAEIPSLVDSGVAEKIKARDDSEAAENKRTSGIEDCGKHLKIDPEIVKSWTADKSLTLEAARDRAFELKASRDDASAVNPSLAAGERDASDVDTLRAVGSLLRRDNRSNKEIRGAMVQLHRERKLFAIRGFDEKAINAFDFERECWAFRTKSLEQMAEISLRKAGCDVDNLGRNEIIESALRTRAAGNNTTTTFPLWLAESFNVATRIGYLEEEPDLSWAMERSAKDFRDQHGIQLGSLDLLEVGQGEHYESSTLAETRDSWRVVKRGRKFGLTLEVIVNDQHGMINQVPAEFAKASARAIRVATIGLVIANPDLSDSTPIFDNSRDNIADVAAATSIDSIDIMRVRLMQRPPLDPNETALSEHRLKFLLVGEGRRTHTDQILGRVLTTPVQPAATIAQAVPTGFGDYVVVSDALIDAVNLGGGLGQAWFGTDGRSFEYGWLEGFQGVQVTQLDPGDIDAVQMKVRTIFGAGFTWGWRGWERNNGAVA